MYYMLGVKKMVIHSILKEFQIKSGKTRLWQINKIRIQGIAIYVYVII